MNIGNSARKGALFCFPRELHHTDFRNSVIYSCPSHEVMSGACTKFDVGKPEGKSPLARPRHRWENNIKMDVCKLDLRTCLKLFDSGRGTSGTLL
jgi:hypothetical protein